MSAPPTIQRFFSEDYKESPVWFQQFLSTANLFTQPVYNAVNGGIDISTNTTGEFYTLNLTNASATGSSNTALFTPKKFVGSPSGVVIAQCLYNVSTGVPTAVGAAVTLDWFFNAGQIQILAVYGLTATASYTLTLYIF